MTHYLVNPAYHKMYTEAKQRLMGLANSASPIPVETIERGAPLDATGDWSVHYRENRRSAPALEYTGGSLDACLAYLATTEGEQGTRTITLSKDGKDIAVLTERNTR